MYGFLVSQNHEQVMQFNKENGNTKWQDVELLKLTQIDDYQSFVDKGHKFRPEGYTKITIHFVYAVKHDGRHKAQSVAGGHTTETPINSVHSTIISLCGIRLLNFLAELNQQEIWATNIVNDYLKSSTNEKVYIVAEPEFGDRAGHMLVISKALYGLKSNGLRWSERFLDVLYEMKFFPSKTEKDIWMHETNGLYEYIGVYVDDLITISKNPKGISDVLHDEYSFKLKGTGPISFHLGDKCYFKMSKLSSPNLR
jgi:hypothetical protein